MRVTVNLLIRGNKELVEGCGYKVLTTHAGIRYTDVKILQIKESEKVTFESGKSVIMNMPFDKIKSWEI